MNWYSTSVSSTLSSQHGELYSSDENFFLRWAVRNSRRRFFPLLLAGFFALSHRISLLYFLDSLSFFYRISHIFLISFFLSVLPDTLLNCRLSFSFLTEILAEFLIGNLTSRDVDESKIVLTTNININYLIFSLK